MPKQIPPAHDTLVLLAAEDDFIRRRGHNPDDIRRRYDAQARLILYQAQIHASGTAASVRARAQFMSSLNAGK
ncbi:MAG: hypothetical protein A3B10_01305 [Candidatus Doudnabacteria bacterium RIFCSPLOWO2_01_FULL_44_21]|uniref:Uncharacterized protein n=1 Tax=Candidatus Doudnabacteria bacterium RIFCSPLOWO2_01_FULL_44_21 TaxID=1817841 RepID=A0A1F5PWX6_9BACT|nr:MAG: hypothetical protein A3B10_01305 [Candidatus Doudnabacteria bacterium RIFCSPLOWO2_01_FULL_44_21]